MGKTLVILAPYWKSKLRPPGVDNCWGLFVLMIFRYHRTLVQRFMLSSKNARFWCLAAPLNVNVCTRVRVLHLYLNYTICLQSSVNNNKCLLRDAILRIPRSSGARDMRGHKTVTWRTNVKPLPTVHRLMNWSPFSCLLIRRGVNGSAQ